MEEAAEDHYVNCFEVKFDEEMKEKDQKTRTLDQNWVNLLLVLDLAFVMFALVYLHLRLCLLIQLKKLKRRKMK